MFAAINVISMGVTVAAAASANRNKKEASREADRIEKAVSELKERVEKISEQLRGIQMVAGPANAGSEPAKESEKKGDPAKPQQKPEDIIYVKKASEFWFYG